MEAEPAKDSIAADAPDAISAAPVPENVAADKGGATSSESGAPATKPAQAEDTARSQDPAVAPAHPIATSAEQAHADDSKMTDAPNDDKPLNETPKEAAASAEKPSVNGTPAASKRASLGGSSKKKSASVPEHKSKKLNKKKSRPLTHLDAQPGEYYFARMKGHPPWPSIVCDESMLPHSLLSTRPVTAALPDGSFKREDYGPGGKRAHERTFPIMFLHTNEFAWIPNTELNPLDPNSDEIQNFQEKGKTKQLAAAYEKAKQGHDLGAFQTMLREHQKAIEEDLALQEEKAAQKAEKANRAAARKHGDDMDVDEPASTEKAKSKKRKKNTEEVDENEKPAKTPKTATKLKLSTPRQPAEATPKKPASKAKPKSSKPAGEGDAQSVKAEEKPLTQAEILDNKEKRVLYFRHRLQRGFLSRDAAPKEDEMEQMSRFIDELKEHIDLEAEIIRSTKIHKVLKQMLKLDNIPREEEFKFIDRANVLLGHWNATLAKDAQRAEGEKPSADQSKVTTDKKEPDSAAKESSADAPAPTTNGGTKATTEGSKAVEPKSSTNAGASDAEDVVPAASAPKAADTEPSKATEPEPEANTANGNGVSVEQSEGNEDSVAAATAPEQSLED